MQTADSIFDDIRPFDSSEIPAAMERMTRADVFPLVSKYLFPDETVEKVAERMLSVRSSNQFQDVFVKYAVEAVVRKSMDSLTWEGLEKISAGVPYLFLSNHRDIALDAAILTYILHENGIPTPQITFGENLMSHPFVVDFGKANKMFKVARPTTVATRSDFFTASQHLSDYLRHCIAGKGESVWIAQRNGRTKNGDDATDQGILKMFGMSCPDDKIAALADLHIVPVSISYEWEPCDILKVMELYESSRIAYMKKPGEDLNSILTGILQPKGRVHIVFGDVLTYKDLLPFDSLTKNSYYKSVAQLLDSRIRSNFALWPNNWIAHDLRYGESRFAARYTPAQKQQFLEHISALDRYDNCDVEELRDRMLGIYSNPVDNLLRQNK